MRCVCVAWVSILAISCAKAPNGRPRVPSDAFVGNWTSDAPRASLDLNADHTFTLKVSKSVSGKWKSSGMVADLESDGPEKPPMNALLSNDKRTLTLTGDPSHPFDPSAVTIDFTK